MNRAIIFLTLAATLTLFLTVENHSQKNSKKGAIVFRIPDNVFPMDWNKSGFKGMLMLEKDSPSGVFISYPNEGETTASLKTRAAKSIFPMFSSGAGDDKYGQDESKWKTHDIPSNSGDKGEFGKYYSLENEKQVTQILIYERESAGKTVIYGYFAKRNKEGKFKKKKWADEKGKGVRLLKKFHKTFRN